MARLIPLHNAFVWLFFLLIATTSASRLGLGSDPLPAFPREKSEPFPSNQTYDISSLGSDPLLQKRYCEKICDSTGTCCPEEYTACCPDGTCVYADTQFCCGGGGRCNNGETCCNGCAPAGSECCWDGEYCPKGEKCCWDFCIPDNAQCCTSGVYCEVGKVCCEGKCIPEGTECCEGGDYCPGGEYCMVFNGEDTCCNDLACSELTDDYEDGGDDESSSETDTDTDVDYSAYYMVVTWTYYYYWYVYVYIVVQVDVTSTTVSLTSTPTTTSSRLTVSATDSSAADAKFYDMSVSIESAAAETTVQDSIPTTGSITTSETDVPDPTPTASVPSFPSPTSTVSGPTSTVSSSSSTVSSSSSTAPDPSPTFTGPYVTPGTNGAAVTTPDVRIFAAAAAMSFVFYGYALIIAAVDGA